MKTKKKEFHAMDEEQEITVRGCNLSVTFEVWNPHISRDGIGAYEFWGAKGFDAGSDYLEEFDIRNIKVVSERTKESHTPKKKLYDLIEKALYESEEKTQRIEKRYLESLQPEY